MDKFDVDSWNGRRLFNEKGWNGQLRHAIMETNRIFLLFVGNCRELHVKLSQQVSSWALSLKNKKKILTFDLWFARFTIVKLSLFKQSLATETQFIHNIKFNKSFRNLTCSSSAYTTLNACEYSPNSFTHKISIVQYPRFLHSTRKIILNMIHEFSNGWEKKTFICWFMLCVQVFVLYVYHASFVAYQI